MPETAPLTVVITGTSSGLGAGMAEYLHQQGLNLGLCSRRLPILKSSASVLAQQVDVCDAQAVEQFARAVEKQFGAIHAWINNAGILDPIGPIRETSPQAFSTNLETNVVGVFNGTRSYIKHIRRHSAGGVLINISSGAALKGYAGWGGYCASKAAVDRLTECASLEESGHGLRAYSVAPGIIDTQMQEKIRACTTEQFPMVEKFHELKRQQAFSSPRFVAEKLLALINDREDDRGQVVKRLPNEKV